MEQITTYKKLEFFPFEDIKEIGSLFFYEESLSSLLISTHGLFVIRWVDLDEDTNLSRWMLFKIDFDTLIRYINKQVGDLEILNATLDKVLFLDIDENGNYSTILEIDLHTIPKNYLPDQSALFVSSACPDIQKITEFIEYSTKAYPKPKKVIRQNFSNTAKKSYTNYYSATYPKQYVGQN